jgi:hypothetical protein
MSGPTLIRSDDPQLRPTPASNQYCYVPFKIAEVTRILSGDTRPEDYLPVTEEIKEFVNKEEARIGFQIHQEARQKLYSELALQVHHRDQEVLVKYTPSGVIVLAAGSDVDPLWEQLTKEQKTLVTSACPSSMMF